MFINRILLPAVAAGLLLPLSAPQAHRNIDVRINAINEQIHADPQNYLLHIKRGELHAEHSEWETALADYDRAQELGPEALAKDLDLLRGYVWLRSGEPALARAALDRYLIYKPGSSQAHLASARVWAALDREEEALDDYNEAITLAKAPTPNLFIERAELLVATGKTQEAIAGIEDGVRRIGPIATLVQFAVETERAAGNNKAALIWIERLSPQLQQSPRWLLVKGDVYADSDDAERATQAWQEARTSINNLPESRQQLPVFQKLMAELETRLGRAG